MCSHLEVDADNGSRRASCSTSTTSTLPSPNSTRAISPAKRRRTAHTWSVVAAAYAAFNRRELPATTRDWVNVDHRRGVAFAPGELTAFIRASWDLTSRPQTLTSRLVHRLSDLGAVFTHASHGTSQEGFDAEWRDDRPLDGRRRPDQSLEMFDEADLDAALARFDELDRRAPQLENAASQVYEHLRACFAARDWDAMAEMLADDVFIDDRRRVVNAGIRHGRDAEIANMRAIADVGVTYMTSTVIATRGERLALTRGDAGNDQRRETFRHRACSPSSRSTPTTGLRRASCSIPTTSTPPSRNSTRVISPAKRPPYARTWSLVAGAYAALNRHELPSTTPNSVNIDHRRAVATAPADLLAAVRALWDVTPDIRYRIEAVHRMSDLGAVFTHTRGGPRKRASMPSGG